MTIRVDYLKIEYVSSKPKFPKFNSGSLKVGEKWYNVAKQVNINSFEAGNTYAVEIDKNEKGFETIIKNKTANELGQEDSSSSVPKKKPFKKEVDWDAKDKAKELGGIGHDVGDLLKYSAMTGKSIKDSLTDWEEGYKGLIDIRGRVK